MFLVKWQDLSEKVVYRRFTEIYEFHVSAWGWGREGSPRPSLAALWGEERPRWAADQGTWNLPLPAHS